ncbi:RNA-binding domain-containing protein [Succinivibrio dextrinosolvens]|uniref:RNA-binding domain-containing protein n=1 Tax=Succinivibrio dextrinosolvens TaxID=83771 RepID=UPI00359FF513
MERESEEEWFEFKENWYSSKDIGDYISSLSNAAAMSGKEYGYLIWGVNNDTHELTGTTFNPHRDVNNEQSKKEGNQPESRFRSFSKGC